MKKTTSPDPRGGRAWRVWILLLMRSWRLDRRATAAVLAFMAADSVTVSLGGIALRRVVNDALAGERHAAGVAALVAGICFAGFTVIARVQQELRLDLADRVGMQRLDTELQRMISGLDTLEHLERSDDLDRISLLRGRGQLMTESSWAVLDSASGVVRVLVTLGLLATVQPALLLLVLLALPALWLNRAGRQAVQRANRASAEADRTERALFELTTGSGPGKELRVFGSGAAVACAAGEAWRRSSRAKTAARWRAALLESAGWAVFMLGFAVALGVVVARVSRGDGSTGDVVLLIALAGTLRLQFQRVAYGMSRVLEGLGSIEPYLWLRERSAAQEARARRTALGPPPRLERSIALREVSFAYPGAQRDALSDLTVELPAGAMVAVVGEHGSGKTTLIKLLCKMYEPRAGRILLDDAPLSAIDATRWRSACSGAFQDFGRYEMTLREAVGIGEPAGMDDEDRVSAALDEAECAALLAALPDGIDSLLGPDGTDLSEGQWQRVALARAAMRPSPLLFVLDEPTASLDPPTEHAVFSRHAQLARRIGARTGAVTVVVTHRFTTVRMADLILVLRGGRLVEQGDHASLLESGGLYADLYRMQEQAYMAKDSA